MVAMGWPSPVEGVLHVTFNLLFTSEGGGGGAQGAKLGNLEIAPGPVIG